jgi:uncharacterized RDD family membrane protein YckC
MTTTTEHDLAVSQQGHYAGAVTRLCAFVVDQFIASTAYTLAVGGLQFAVALVSDVDFKVDNYPILLAITYTSWLFIYYAYSWAAAGRTLGMTLVGLRVVRGDGAAISVRQAVVRALAMPLSFLIFGLGFLGILIGRKRRALHDVIADTAVVYGWDARAARLRFLAHQDPTSGAAATTPAPPT